MGLLQAFLQHRTTTAAALGIELPPNAYLFSTAPDGSTPPRPDSVSQRYTRMCERLGLDAHLHQLRHYSATELIAAGVDIRTVAGRLGHGGGGSTTLRVYGAWVAEADQRAATSLTARLPTLAGDGVDPSESALGRLSASPADDSPGDSPAEAIASDLRAAIRCGALEPGDLLSTVKELAGDVLGSAVDRPPGSRGVDTVRSSLGDSRQAGDRCLTVRDAHTLALRLQEARWDTITEARLRGATWDDVAHAMNETTINVRADCTTMVDWVAKNQPGFADRDRYCRAL